jgi:hypothetical protein
MYIYYQEFNNTICLDYVKILHTQIVNVIYSLVLLYLVKIVFIVYLYVLSYISRKLYNDYYNNIIDFIIYVREFWCNLCLYYLFKLFNNYRFISMINRYIKDFQIIIINFVNTNIINSVNTNIINSVNTNIIKGSSKTTGVNTYKNF